jgi:hypothetical protein
MASNILEITFIIGKHIPHKIDFTCNKHIKQIPFLNVVIHYLNSKIVIK